MFTTLPAVGCVAVVCAVASCGAYAKASTQDITGMDEAAGVPVLGIDEAVAMALSSNRNVKVASLNVDASRQQWLAAKTKRFPSLSTYVFGGETLTTINFKIKEGQLGTFQATGPIPAHDINLSTSPSPTAFVVGQASQPLLTLYKVNLNLRAAKLSVAQAGEQSRSARESISASVHQAYHGIVQAEQAVEATKASIQQYEELDRITAEYVAEKTALASDNLQVKAKLAQERLSLMQNEDKLQSGKESLNDLLGRDINVAFRTVAVAEPSSTEEDLKAAQAKALLNHPEIKQAAITVKQADIQKRLAKAQYLPDINASFRYISPFGIDFLPSNIAAVGFEVSWEPYDWGRRRHTLDQKNIALEQSKQQLDETKAQILVNLDTQFRSLGEARAAIEVAKANQESTREKLREVTAQYGQKAVLLRDVLEQQAASEQANAQAIQAIAAYWTAEANFHKAVGEE